MHFHVVKCNAPNQADFFSGFRIEVKRCNISSCSNTLGNFKLSPVASKIKNTQKKNWSHSLKPETNIFAPETWDGWNTMEYDRFLLGPGLFSGAKMLVSGRVRSPKHFRLLNIGFLAPKGIRLWKIFQSHPIFRGHNLCLFVSFGSFGFQGSFQGSFGWWFDVCVNASIRQMVTTAKACK